MLGGVGQLERESKGLWDSRNPCDKMCNCTDDTHSARKRSVSETLPFESANILQLLQYLGSVTSSLKGYMPIFVVSLGHIYC